MELATIFVLLVLLISAVGAALLFRFASPSVTVAVLTSILALILLLGHWDRESESLSLPEVAAGGARPTSTAPRRKSAAEIAAALRSVDLSRYDPSNFSRAFARYGRDYLHGPVQQIREEAARAAATDLRCDHVELAEWSEARSTVSAPAAFVDCRNGFRLYFNRRGVMEVTRHPLRY